MISFSITVEPLTLLFIAAITCEYTLIQYSVSTSHCLSLANLTDPTVCESPKSSNISSLIKDDVTVSMRYYNGFLSLFCSIAMLFTGSWSDHYGRRLPIMFALLSSLIAQTLCIIYWLTLDHNWIWLIYSAGLVSGLSGSSASLIANCFGYIADITTVNQRSQAMAVMEAMLYLGNAIGFSTGSLMIKLFGIQLAYGFALLFLIHFSLSIYVFWYLKESKDSVDQPTIQGLFRLTHITSVIRTVIRPRRPLSKRVWLITIICCAFIAMFSSNALLSILYVFLRNRPLHWSSELYGYLQSINYLIGGCTLLVLVPLANRLIPQLISDDLLAILGFTSRSIGLIVLGLSQSTLHAFLSPLAFIFSELTLPSLRSIISKLVDNDEKGKAFAFLGLLSNLTFLLGSQLSSFIYQKTSSWFPGFVLIILGLSDVIPLTVFFVKSLAFRSINENIIDHENTQNTNNLGSQKITKLSTTGQHQEVGHNKPSNDRISYDDSDKANINKSLSTGIDRLASNCKTKNC